MDNNFQYSAAAAAAAISNNNSTINNTNTTAPPPQNSHSQNSLRSLNKSSYKISKPSARNPNPNPNPSNPSPNPPPSNPSPSPQSQPPVYNIDKSDFREIVQKLTGSPAHRHAPSSTSPSSSPPPLPPITTSRLHRIRPPPLSNLSHVVGPPPVEVWARPALSPLPPLPTISAAAESPITAYMRRLRGGPSPTAAAASSGAPPLSPLGFGCYGLMLSPSLLMPTSPRMTLPSPRSSSRTVSLRSICRLATYIRSIGRPQVLITTSSKSKRDFRALNLHIQFSSPTPVRLSLST